MNEIPTPREWAWQNQRGKKILVCHCEET
uniref:Uncharacterized protein n=1 Tax=Pygocentrus nattereri TaxID=42514 RepID=A0AAR2LN22_PYGNA